MSITTHTHNTHNTHTHTQHTQLTTHNTTQAHTHTTHTHTPEQHQSSIKATRGLARSHCRSRGRGCQTWHGRATMQTSRLSIRVHKIVHKQAQEQSKRMGYYTSNHKSNQRAPHSTLANTKAINVHQILSMAINMHDL